MIGQSKYVKKESYDFTFQLTNQNVEFDILPIMNCSGLGNTNDVIHFDLLLFRPIYYSVSTRKWKSIGIGNSTELLKTQMSYVVFHWLCVDLTNMIP